MVTNLQNHQDKPLVVDLDGTLIKTELPWESFLAVLISRPFGLIKILTHRILHGNRVSLKKNLEKQAALDLKTLPLSESFLNFLKTEKSKGRALFLCTGSTQSYADKISKNISLFKEAFGSLTGSNLVGNTKAVFLKTRFKEKGFDYAGNALVDLKVARQARKFIVVNPSLSLLWVKKTSQYRGAFSSIINFFYKKHHGIPWDKTFGDKKKTFSQLVFCAGGGLWILNICVYFLFKTRDFTGEPAIFGLCFLASGFYMFFLMSRIFLDRKRPPALIQNQKKKHFWSLFFHWSGLKQSRGYPSNIFARGDLSLETGFFIVGGCLSLACGFFIGSVYEHLPHVSFSQIRFLDFSWESTAAYKILSFTGLSMLYVGGVYLWLYRMYLPWKVSGPLALLIFIFVPFCFF